jgi:hypothetical protein
MRGRLLTAGLHLHAEVAAAVTAGEERRKQYKGNNLPRSSHARNPTHYTVHAPLPGCSEGVARIS